MSETMLDWSKEALVDEIERLTRENNAVPHVPPREPTEAMLRAAEEFLQRTRFSSEPWTAELWTAMYDASPKVGRNPLQDLVFEQTEKPLVYDRSNPMPPFEFKYPHCGMPTCECGEAETEAMISDDVHTAIIAVLQKVSRNLCDCREEAADVLRKMGEES